MSDIHTDFERRTTELVQSIMTTKKTGLITGPRYGTRDVIHHVVAEASKFGTNQTINVYTTGKRAMGSILSRISQETNVKRTTSEYALFTNGNRVNVFIGSPASVCDLEIWDNVTDRAHWDRAGLIEIRHEEIEFDQVVSGSNKWMAYAVWVSGEGDTAAMDSEPEIPKAMKEYLQSGETDFVNDDNDGFCIAPKKWTFTTKQDRDTAVQMAEQSWIESIAEGGHCGSATFFVTPEQIESLTTQNAR